MAVSDFLRASLRAGCPASAPRARVREAAVAPYRGVEDPQTPRSRSDFRSANRGVPRCVFGLTRYRRLTRRSRTIPSFFWSHDGSSGVLMLHLGVVPEAALSELWLPSGTCDEICDLIPVDLPGLARRPGPGLGRGARSSGAKPGRAAGGGRFGV